MRASAFFLADHAEAINGKLYVTGGCWDRIFVQNLPARHNHMSIVFSLVVPWTATNEKHQMLITLEDADGKNILPGELKGDFEMGRPPGWRPGDDANMLGVFNINDLQFEKDGRYAFILKIDGEPIARCPLLIQKLSLATVTG